jgi:adenylylsulfate kinase
MNRPNCYNVSMTRAIALWITGLPGSGKSTLAQELKKAHPDFVVLTMDEMRKTVTPEPSYSDAERDLVYRGLVYTASVLVRQGHPVIIDATGNMRKWRELARTLIPAFGEIYLKCPPELCRQRERKRTETHGAPKDIYAKGERGWPVPGLSAPYEEPESPELLIETDRLSLPEAVSLADELIAKMRAGEKAT